VDDRWAFTKTRDAGKTTGEEGGDGEWDGYKKIESTKHEGVGGALGDSDSLARTERVDPKTIRSQSLNIPVNVQGRK